VAVQNLITATSIEGNLRGELKLTILAQALFGPPILALSSSGSTWRSLRVHLGDWSCGGERKGWQMEEA